MLPQKNEIKNRKIVEQQQKQPTDPASFGLKRKFINLTQLTLLSVIAGLAVSRNGGAVSRPFLHDKCNFVEASFRKEVFFVF